MLEDMETNAKERKTKFPPLLHLAYILQQQADELLLREVGVSLSHVRIMSGLSVLRAKSQRALAVELSQTEANISRQLKVMKKQGLVTVEKNKKDGRTRDVRLTQKSQGSYQTAVKLLSKQKNWTPERLNAQLEIIDHS